jgi:hypothetical protein
VSNQHRTADSCSLCALRVVLFQLDHLRDCHLLTWSQGLALTAIRRLARVLLAQVLPITRANGPSCTECERYNRRRGLNVPPTQTPFRMFHD